MNSNLGVTSFFSIAVSIASGVVLIVIGFVGAKVYHEWWLNETDWSGNILGTTSRFDRAIGWLPRIGVLLIASALLWACIGVLLKLISK